MITVACQQCHSQFQLPNNWQEHSFCCPGCKTVNHAPFLPPVVALSIPTVPRVVDWQPRPQQPIVIHVETTDSTPIRTRPRRTSFAQKISYLLGLVSLLATIGLVAVRVKQTYDVVAPSIPTALTVPTEPTTPKYDDWQHFDLESRLRDNGVKFESNTPPPGRYKGRGPMVEFLEVGTAEAFRQGHGNLLKDYYIECELCESRQAALNRMKEYRSGCVAWGRFFFHSHHKDMDKLLYQIRDALR